MNKNKKSYIIAGLLTGLLFATAVSSVALAQSTPTDSITLSPVSKRYEIDAGETKTDQFTIINHGDTDYDFIVYAKPYYAADSDYNPDFDSKRANADAHKWVRFDKTKYHLDAGQSVKVGYTVSIPANAAPGGHYGVLFAETQPKETPTSGANIGRNRRVGSIMFITVNGQYSVGAKIGDVKTALFQTSKPLSAATTVQNTGNADFRTTIQFTVEDIFGNRKYFDEKINSVLPETTRNFELKWAKSPILGLYKTTMVITALDQEKKDSSYVFLAPVWLYGLIALTVVLVVVYVITRRRR